MGLGATWRSITGASPGTDGTAEGTFGGADETASQAVNDPISQGQNSIKKFFKIQFTADGTGDNTASNILIKRSDATGTSGNIDGNGTFIHAKAGETYAQESSTTMTGGTNLQESGNSSIGLDDITTPVTGTNSVLSQLFAVQVQTGASADAGKSFTLQCTFDVTVA